MIWLLDIHVLISFQVLMINYIHLIIFGLTYFEKRLQPLTSIVWTQKSLRHLKITVLSWRWKKTELLFLICNGPSMKHFHAIFAQLLWKFIREIIPWDALNSQPVLSIERHSIASSGIWWDGTFRAGGWEKAGKSERGLRLSSLEKWKCCFSWRCAAGAALALQTTWHTASTRAFHYHLNT